MKVVINSCYGGFSLSREAMVEYYKQKGVTVYLFIASGKKFVRFDPEKHKKNSLIYYRTVPEWTDNDYSTWADKGEIQLDDPILVGLVESMGDAANGEYSKLRIVNVPDDANWEINDYDGMESIHEIHRTWY